MRSRTTKHPAPTQTTNGSDLVKSVDDLQTLTADEVATILRCSIKTLGRYCRKGVFPRPTKIGRLVRWKKSVVAEFLSKNQPQISEC